MPGIFYKIFRIALIFGIYIPFFLFDLTEVRAEEDLPAYSLASQLDKTDWLKILEDFESGDPWDVRYKFMAGREIAAITTVSSLEQTPGKGSQYLFVQVDGLTTGGIRVIPRKEIRLSGFLRFLKFQIRCYANHELIYLDIKDYEGNRTRHFLTSCNANGWKHPTFAPDPSIKQTDGSFRPGGISIEGLYIQSEGSNIRMLIDDITAEIRPFRKEYDPFPEY